MDTNRIEPMADLIKKAKSDPKFFHTLIWDTEKALSDVPFLSLDEKAAILRVKPEDLVVSLAGGRINPGTLAADDCGSSCGVSCGGSCGISCGISCATSCATSSLVTDPGVSVKTPTEILTSDIQKKLIDANFSRFTR